MHPLLLLRERRRHECPLVCCFFSFTFPFFSFFHFFLFLPSFPFSSSFLLSFFLPFDSPFVSLLYIMSSCSSRFAVNTFGKRFRLLNRVSYVRCFFVHSVIIPSFLYFVLLLSPSIHVCRFSEIVIVLLGLVLIIQSSC